MKNPEGWPIFNNVPWTIVSEFFKEYKWVDSATRANGELIRTYIDAHQGSGDMEKWNIFIYQISSANVPIIDLGNGISATAIQRSALDKSKEKHTVNIHHLVSSIDGSADVGLSKKSVTAHLKSQGKKVSDTTLRALREESSPSVNRGLLGIYIVDKDSKKEPKAKLRQDLELPEHAVGLGIFFGKSTVIGADVDYIGADLIDLFEIEEDDYLDDADESDDSVTS
jgi:hypothetical protein